MYTIREEDIIRYLSRIEKKLDNFIKYVIPNTSKQSEQDIEICKKILTQNLYITTELIKNHPILGIKYTHPYALNNLIDTLLKQDKTLTFTKTGQGNKKYIYKKENEKEVKSKILSIKHKSKNRFKTTEINEIGNYLSQNYAGKRLKTEAFREIFLWEFNIKSKDKVDGILRQLYRMGRLEKLDVGIFKVVGGGI